MLVYVEWKIDLNNQNKVNIIRVREEKDPMLKYTISKHKFVLGSIELLDGFDQDDVFFTRVNIGNCRTNWINLMICESVSNINMNTIIEITMFGSISTQTTAIKCIHRVKLFLDKNNWPTVQENIISEELSNFVNVIKKNKIQTKIDKYGNNYTLYLSEVNME